jgi:small subunit ribosomal protein S1
MAEENKIAENNESEQVQNEQQIEEQAQELVNETPNVEEIAEVEVENPVEETPVIEEREISEVKKTVVEIPVHKEVKPLEDFNWEEIGKDQQIYSDTEQKNLEDIYSQTFKSIIEQDVVDGIVVAKTAREIVVNIGYKSDGVIPANELRHNPNLKIGDVIEVYVEKQEDATGQLVLSHKKARLLKSWNRVNDAFDKGEIINGYIKSKTKGGLIVDVFGIEAFLPGSQIDVKPIRDYDVFVDKTMDFKS